MSLDLIVPVLMGTALLWWIGRGLSWSARLIVIIITLALVILIVMFERSDWLSSPQDTSPAHSGPSHRAALH